MTIATPLDQEQILQRARGFCAPFRIDDGDAFRLKDVDPQDTLTLDPADKNRARQVLSEGVEILAQLQDKLYAQDRWAVLLMFQAMDAAGKDGTIKHVMSGVNPQGCQAAAVIDTLDSLNLKYPKLSEEALRELEEARRQLDAEKG